MHRSLVALALLTLTACDPTSRDGGTMNESSSAAVESGSEDEGSSSDASSSEGESGSISGDGSSSEAESGSHGVGSDDESTGGDESTATSDESAGEPAPLCCGVEGYTADTCPANVELVPCCCDLDLDGVGEDLPYCPAGAPVVC